MKNKLLNRMNYNKANYYKANYIKVKPQQRELIIKLTQSQAKKPAGG